MAESESSTLLSADVEKNKQGTHELELHFGGELDLHQHFICQKNPGHVDFIPIPSLLYCPVTGSFEKDNRNLLYFSLKAEALTTKLKVRYVSSKRSKMKEIKSDYPLLAYAGQRNLSFGSGCATGIDVSGDEGSFPCPLKNCPHAKEPHHVYGYIIIATAAHVVFDDDEAKETIVEFFDDDPKDKKYVETAYGVKVKHSSLKGDFCEFMCVTHSQSLIGKISQLCLTSGPYVPYLSFMKKGVAVRILRLLKIIRIIHTRSKDNSNLLITLATAQHTREETIQFLSGWQVLHCKGVDLLMEYFLSVAESVSGVSDLKNSVHQFIYQDKAEFHRETLLNEIMNPDMETTVKRIVLMGAMHLLMPEELDPECFFDGENIYNFFSDVLLAVEDVYSQPQKLFTESPVCLLSLDSVVDRYFKNMFRGFRDSQGFRAKGDLYLEKCGLPLMCDMLDIMLKCQLIIKLSPQETESFPEIMGNINCISDYLDQAAENLGDIHSSVTDNVDLSHIPEYDFTEGHRSRYLIQLWVTEAATPSDDDLLRAILDVHNKMLDLCLKTADIENTLRSSDSFESVFSSENLTKSLADTREIFCGVAKCFHQIKEAFIQEVKPILHVSKDVFQQKANDTLLMHISHPHGQSKQVTIGTHFSCNTNTGHYEHIYTVPTCNGCSGGPVWVLPRGEGGEILWNQIYGVPHGGCYDRGNKLNHSSSWTFSPFSEGHERNELNSIVPKPHRFGSLCVPLQSSFSAAETPEGKRWLLYLLRSVDSLFLSGMTAETAIDLKKSRGSAKRISPNDDVEGLLNLACQYEWPWRVSRERGNR